MAQYRGTLSGQRGTASRLGNKKSGLKVTCNGWEIGITVYATYDEDAKEDVMTVYLTGGSTPTSPDKLIGEYRKAKPA